MAAEKTAETSVGMPQLDFSTFSNQAFWLIVVLCALFLLIRLLVIPRMDNILTNRRKVIEEDLIAAETIKDSSEKLKSSITLEIEKSKIKASDTISKAKDKIKERYTTGMAEASEITGKLIEDSEKNIEKIQKSAKKEIEKIAKVLEPEIIEQIVSIKKEK
jgi:F-type H+-transporting ATPase subunit b